MSEQELRKNPGSPVSSRLKDKGALSPEHRLTVVDILGRMNQTMDEVQEGLGTMRDRHFFAPDNKKDPQQFELFSKAVIEAQKMLDNFEFSSDPGPRV